MFRRIIQKNHPEESSRRIIQKNHPPKFTGITVVQVDAAMAGQMSEHLLLVLVKRLCAEEAAASLIVAEHDAVLVGQMLLERGAEGELLSAEAALEVVHERLMVELGVLLELFETAKPARTERALELDVRLHVVLAKRPMRNVDQTADLALESNDLFAVLHLLIDLGVVVVQVLEQAGALTKVCLTRVAAVVEFQRAVGLRLLQVRAQVTIVAVDRAELGGFAGAALVAMVGRVQDQVLD